MEFKKALIVPGYALILSLVGSQAAFCGANSGGGGDAHSIEFIQVANRMAEHIFFIPEHDRLGLDPKLVSETIYSVQVQSVDGKLELNGKSVDAINYPDEKRIEISRASWDGMDAQRRQILALHEYLGIMRIADERYQISRHVTTHRQELLNVCESDDVRFREETNQFFLSKGYVAQGYTGNHTNTLSGAYLYSLRAYSIKWNATDPSRGGVSQLLRVGECNPYTGKYEAIMYSGSGESPDACR